MSDNRDWDKELADIDKLMAQPGAAAAPAKGGPVAPAGRAAVLAPSRSSKAATFTGWLRVLLALLLAVAVPVWPFLHVCGGGLMLYLGAVGVTVLAGLWSAVTSWRRRLPLAHVLSLLVVLWGLALAAMEVLPRMGYAKQALTWVCAA